MKFMKVAVLVVSRAAIEVVTERQTLASWRCRFRITTSERQRLRIDLPIGCDLQAPLLNDQRTTIEKASDINAAEQWEAYYVNINRDSTSDQEFLLTLLFRCPITNEGTRPYAGRGSRQMSNCRSSAKAEAQPRTTGEVALVGSGRNCISRRSRRCWTQEGAAPSSLLRPLKSPSAVAAAAAVNDWIDPGQVASGDFPTQGSASVYRALVDSLKLP